MINNEKKSINLNKWFIDDKQWYKSQSEINEWISTREWLPVQ